MAKNVNRIRMFTRNMANSDNSIAIGLIHGNDCTGLFNIGKRIALVRRCLVNLEHFSIPCDGESLAKCNELMRDGELISDASLCFEVITILNSLRWRVTHEEAYSVCIEPTISKRRSKRRRTNYINDCDECKNKIASTSREPQPTSWSMSFDNCKCGAGYPDGIPFKIIFRNAPWHSWKNKYVKDMNLPEIRDFLDELEGNKSRAGINSNEFSELKIIERIEANQHSDLIRDLRMGNYPILTIHNLSAILTKIPSSGKDSKSLHWCVFCGDKCSRRDELLHHVQRYHSGFVAECVYCSEVMNSEKGLLLHVKKQHGFKGRYKLTCGRVKQVYDESTSILGKLLERNYSEKRSTQSEEGS